MPERESHLQQAVREALAEELRRDARVCIIGEGRLPRPARRSKCSPD